MAEKEEFLFVMQVEENDELRNITPYCNGCTFYPCDKECINRKKPITRQEAINRMAKAIWETGYNKVLNIPFDKLKTESHKSNSKTFGNFYKLTLERAEAALNALLEADK